MRLERPLPFFIRSRIRRASCSGFEAISEAVIVRFIHNDLIGKIYSHIFHSGVVVWVNHDFPSFVEFIMCGKLYAAIEASAFAGSYTNSSTLSSLEHLQPHHTQPGRG